MSNRINPPRVLQPDNNERYAFEKQPRHIKFLVCVFFPVYGACRLSLKLVKEVAIKTIEFGDKIINVCGKVYNVCKQVYVHVAPTIYNNFLQPFIIRPLKVLIIEPVIQVFQILFDVAASMCTIVGNVLTSVFTSVSNTWNSLWSSQSQISDVPNVD